MKNIWAIAFNATTATPNQRATWLPATTPAAASSCSTPTIMVIQPQVRRLPKTKCALGTKTCDWKIAARPSIRLKQPMIISRTDANTTQPRPSPTPLPRYDAESVLADVGMPAVGMPDTGLPGVEIPGVVAPDVMMTSRPGWRDLV